MLTVQTPFTQLLQLLSVDEKLLQLHQYSRCLQFEPEQLSLYTVLVPVPSKQKSLRLPSGTMTSPLVAGKFPPSESVQLVLPELELDEEELDELELDELEEELLDIEILVYVKGAVGFSKSLTSEGVLKITYPVRGLLAGGVTNFK